MKNLKKLIEWRCTYEISIQFWPEQTAVYISKRGVELTSFGSSDDKCITLALEYLDRINRVKKVTIN